MDWAQSCLYIIYHLCWQVLWFCSFRSLPSSPLVFLSLCPVIPFPSFFPRAIVLPPLKSLTESFEPRLKWSLPLFSCSPGSACWSCALFFLWNMLLSQGKMHWARTTLTRQKSPCSKAKPSCSHSKPKTKTYELPSQFQKHSPCHCFADNSGLELALSPHCFSFFFLSLCLVKKKSSLILRLFLQEIVLGKKDPEWLWWTWLFLAMLCQHLLLPTTNQSHLCKPSSSKKQS